MPYYLGQTSPDGVNYTQWLVKMFFHSNNVNKPSPWYVLCKLNGVINFQSEGEKPSQNSQ